MVEKCINSQSFEHALLLYFVLLLLQLFSWGRGDLTFQPLQKNDSFKIKQRDSLFLHWFQWYPKLYLLSGPHIQATSYSSSTFTWMIDHSSTLSKCPIGLDLFPRLPTSNYPLLFSMPCELIFSLSFTVHSHLFLARYQNLDSHYFLSKFIIFFFILILDQHFPCNIHIGFRT